MDDQKNPGATRGGGRFGLALHDVFWSRISRILGRQDHLGLLIDNRQASSTLDVDVCIVTNCGYPGGNSATTVTEVEAFEAAGLSVAIVHCTIKRSRWKWNWIAERYRPVVDRIISAHWVTHINCRHVIVRAPRVIMSASFARVAPKINPEKAILVVNNSARNEEGGAVFSWPALHKRVAELGWPQIELCPTGPIIREESMSDLAGTGVTDMLSARDWPPVVEETSFRFEPHSTFGQPTVIGRHARDHPGKWLNNKHELLQVYPEQDPDIRVRILGGAQTVEGILGYIPSTWEVLPFGHDGVQRYLETLDVFVNFPSPERYEAFGRTIVEANLAGVPVILPHRFEATFGDLAFYSSPAEVRRLIQRLKNDDSGRIAYLRACRDLAKSLYCAPSLLSRLQEGGSGGAPHLEETLRAWRASVMQGH